MAARESGPKPGRRFATTQWSLVLAAGNRDSPDFRTALAELCERYWYPIYAFVRRRGADAEQAQDLTQGFFSHLLERGTLRVVDRERGRFRSFLLGALKFYLADERDRALAQKRGGGAVSLSLDLDDAESRYRLEADPEDAPDNLFAKRWALEVLKKTHEELRREARRSANPERQERLAALLTGESEQPYREIADELGMSETALKVSIHRLRKRFGALLRDEVRRTVEDPDKVEEELRFLLQAVGQQKG